MGNKGLESFGLNAKGAESHVGSGKKFIKSFKELKILAKKILENLQNSIVLEVLNIFEILAIFEILKVLK